MVVAENCDVTVPRCHKSGGSRRAAGPGGLPAKNVHRKVAVSACLRAFEADPCLPLQVPGSVVRRMFDLLARFNVRSAFQIPFRIHDVRPLYD